VFTGLGLSLASIAVRVSATGIRTGGAADERLLPSERSTVLRSKIARVRREPEVLRVMGRPEVAWVVGREAHDATPSASCHENPCASRPSTVRSTSRSGSAVPLGQPSSVRRAFSIARR